jgi:hypothetical protein
MTFLNRQRWHSLTVLGVLAVLPAFAQFYGAPIPTQTKVEAAQSSTLLADNFTLWTTSSALLTALAAASSSPLASFVTPQLSFSQSGMQMTGPTEDYQTTGVQSLSAFTAPYTVVTYVAATQGTGDPFEIFLASADLTQFLTVTANVSPVYGGFWATAPNISQIWQLGEQF